MAIIYYYINKLVGSRKNQRNSNIITINIRYQYTTLILTTYNKRHYVERIRREWNFTCPRTENTNTNERNLRYIFYDMTQNYVIEKTIKVK